MSQVATRLLSLILLMQSRRTWKASELSAELGVSVRTVHRYMGMLEEMGIPIYSERGPYGGFALMRGYRLPPLVFSAEEATVLYMGAHLVREVWGETYRDAVIGSTAKLDNVLPDELRQEVARLRQNLVIGGLTAIDYRPWDAILDLLRHCIGERRCVRLMYRALGQKLTERTVDPYALAFQFGLWYLVGHCHLRGEMRTFRVDRIHDATPVEGQFSIPRDFDASAYLQQTMEPDRAHTVAVQLEASVAPLVREQHGRWMQIEDHADGSATARFQVASLDWAVAWILSQGPAARVLEPPELVERIRQIARDIAAQYDPPDVKA
ncbi:MAG: YafY family transcriptional regulator [Anaerolineae bacterium]|nr:YafY family transcriptional regulator [Anaerolineae bacterium]